MYLNMCVLICLNTCSACLRSKIMKYGQLAEKDGPGVRVQRMAIKVEIKMVE